MPQTPYIILRKTPYMESSLIVSGISPEYGRLDFILRGALKGGKKKFPFAVLFRELTVECRLPDGDSTLGTLQSQEPLYCHDSVALHTETYFAACEYAAFLLKNTRCAVPVPRSYQAFSCMLKKAAETGKANPWIPYAKLVFLHENGFVSVPPEKEKILDMVFRFAEGGTVVPPPFNERYQKDFIIWIHALAAHCIA